jgi:4-hydroxybenzoate polyprenyltransferase
MHLFSAIPDIKADAQAQLRTTAVVLGRRFSLIICTALWMAAAGIAIWISIWLIPLVIYPILTGWLLSKNQSWIETAYWWFPMINIAVGFWLFLIGAVL